MEIIQERLTIEDIIRDRYEYTYRQHGKYPTRMILGWEVIKMVEALYFDNPEQYSYNQVDITCLGIPVTVDTKKGRLIHMSIDEDFEV